MQTTVHPAATTAAMLRAVAREAQTIGVFAESSSSMLWLTQAIREQELAPYFRISTHYGSMGHAIAGALGFCAATGMRAVVLTGDGSFHLMNPLPVAVKHGLRLAMVVLNNGMLGLPWFGSQHFGDRHAQATTPLAPWDFTCQGSAGVGGRRVFDEAELDGALAQALAADGCYVVDVATDPRAEPPAGERLRGLNAMFGAGDAPRDHTP